MSDWSVLGSSLWVTLITTFEGLALAVIGGVGLAVLFNQSRLVEYSLYPYAIILQVTPVVAIAPLLLIYLPQQAAVLACAWIVAFFPVLANTTLGLASVDHNLVDLFRLYGASRGRVLWLLKLPAALPYMLGGLKIAGGLSLIGAVVAEIAAGSAGAGSGLAYRIAESGYRLNIPRMFAALLLLVDRRHRDLLRAVARLAPAAAPLARERDRARELTYGPNVSRTAIPSAAMMATSSTRPRCSTKASTARDHRERAGLEIERQRIERVPAQPPGVLLGDLPEQDMQREPDRKIEDDADDRGGDGGERARQALVGAQLLDERRAGEDPQHRRREGDPGGHGRAEDAGGDGRERRGVAKGGEEADELRDQDQRPGRRLGEAEAVDHLRRGHPVMGLDRLLRHVGEQRIGAAEAHHRELGEERADAHEHMVAARATAPPARPAPTTRQARSPRRCRTAASGRGAGGATARHRPSARAAPAQERATKKPMSAAAATISGNGSAKKKMPMKAAPDEPEQQRGLERAPADADERFDHDHQHGRLDAEQRAVHHREAAPERVEQAQAQHHDSAPGSTNRMPAASPPRVPCSSQPI